jgi:GDP-L-fucose synthase
MISKSSKIFVAGHNGLVGTSIVRRLKYFGFKKIITRTKKQLDLRDQKKVKYFFKNTNIDAVINAAGTVGGIYANNTYKADFIYDNLSIQNNIINSCYLNKINNLIFLGSSCIYPRDSKQPIKEKFLLNGPLEKTNEPYAIAKIAGIKMCESYNFQYKTNYKCLMPCNLYGPNDNFNLKTSHFLPALIIKIFLAEKKKKKKIVIWGTGNPKRELMYVDDLADACIFFLKKKTKETLINVGSSNEMSILDYAKFIIKKLGADVQIKFDKSKPDGTPRKIIDSSIAIKYGWKHKVDFEKGLDLTINYVKNNLHKLI